MFPGRWPQPASVFFLIVTLKPDLMTIAFANPKTGGQQAENRNSAKNPPYDGHHAFLKANTKDKCA